jgi:hypothetical protein
MVRRSRPSLPVRQLYASFSLNLQLVGVALLPPEHEFILNQETGHFIVVNWADRCIISDGEFGQLERAPALALLHHWPSYVPNEKLLTAIATQAPEEMAEAVDDDHAIALKLLQSVMNGCQECLQPIGIKVEEVSRRGYKLSLFQRGRSGGRAGHTEQPGTTGSRRSRDIIERREPMARFVGRLR